MYLTRLAAFFLVFTGCCLAFCSPRKERTITHSYYYWRSDGAITPAEKKFLRDHHVSKLYVRLLDIDWSVTQGAIPVSSGHPDRVNHQLNKFDSLQIDIVPVVFITNRTFELIDSSDMLLFAKRVIRRCWPGYDEPDRNYEQNNYSYLNSPVYPNEIQFDCDWTSKTRNKYFYFLKLINELLPRDTITVSATIRLHQYKYPDKTGVPPVNKGMLMVYNVTDPRQYTTTNSIYDDKKARAYFTSAKKYQLPLDIALPAYSWCLVFRDKKFYQIENGLSENELQQLSFVEKSGNGFYQVKQDTVFNDLFLRPGDEIKAERIDGQTLQQAANLSKKALNADIVSIALFELSEPEINNYSHETVEAVYHSFR